MPFLPPNQQRQSTEGISSYLVNANKVRVSDSGRHLLQSASDRLCIVPSTYGSFVDRSLVLNCLPLFLEIGH